MRPLCLARGSGQSRSTRGARGFTLVEMLVVLLLSTVVLMAFYVFVSSQMMSAYEESSEIELQSDLRSTMSALILELEGSRLTSLDSNGVWVSYQVPVTGTSGSFILDATGEVQYGANPFDNSGFMINGYYTLAFKDESGANKIFIESQMISPNYPSGQNISGSVNVSATGVATIPYDKAYVFGHFEVQCYTSAGVAVGSPRNISGKCLRQFDPTDTAAMPKRTYPWGGGFFYMRNTLAVPTLNAAGTGPASNPPLATDWSPQMADGFLSSPGNTGNQDTNGNGVWDPAESYTDTNNNGKWDAGEPFVDTNNDGIWTAAEPFTDENGNGQYEGPDCDPFYDTNGNNVKDSNELVATPGATSATPWSANLRIIVRSFDAQKALTVTKDRRDSAATIRTLMTKVKIRNK